MYNQESNTREHIVHTNFQRRRSNTKAESVCRKAVSNCSILKPYFLEDYNRDYSSKIAQGFERYIKGTRNCKKETEVFIEDVRNKILYLHFHDKNVAKVSSLYPFSENHTKLFMQYILLECRVFEKQKFRSNISQLIVQNRILKLLLTIYRAYFESKYNPPEKIMKECAKAIIHLFIDMRNQFDLNNKIVENIVQLMLKKTGDYEKIQALMGTHIPSPLDTFLRNTEVLEACKNIITSDYGTDESSSPHENRFEDFPTKVQITNTESSTRGSRRLSLDESDDDDVIHTNTIQSSNNENGFLPPRRVHTISLDDDDDGDSKGKLYWDNEVQTSKRSLKFLQDQEKQRHLKIREKQNEAIRRIKPLQDEQIQDKKPFKSEYDIVDLDSSEDESTSNYNKCNTNSTSQVPITSTNTSDGHSLQSKQTHHKQMNSDCEILEISDDDCDVIREQNAEKELLNNKNKEIVQHSNSTSTFSNCPNEKPNELWVNTTNELKTDVSLDIVRQSAESGFVKDMVDINHTESTTKQSDIHKESTEVLVETKTSNIEQSQTIEVECQKDLENVANKNEFDATERINLKEVIKCLRTPKCGKPLLSIEHTTELTTDSSKEIKKSPQSNKNTILDSIKDDSCRKIPTSLSICLFPDSTECQSGVKVQSEKYTTECVKSSDTFDELVESSNQEQAANEHQNNKKFKTKIQSKLKKLPKGTTKSKNLETIIKKIGKTKRNTNKTSLQETDSTKPDNSQVQISSDLTLETQIVPGKNIAVTISSDKSRKSSSLSQEIIKSEPSEVAYTQKEISQNKYRINSLLNEDRVPKILEPFDINQETSIENNVRDSLCSPKMFTKRSKTKQTSKNTQTNKKCLEFQQDNKFIVTSALPDQNKTLNTKFASFPTSVDSVYTTNLNLSSSLDSTVGQIEDLSMKSKKSPKRHVAFVRPWENSNRIKGSKETYLKKTFQKIENSSTMKSEECWHSLEQRVKSDSPEKLSDTVSKIENPSSSRPSEELHYSLEQTVKIDSSEKLCDTVPKIENSSSRTSYELHHSLEQNVKSDSSEKLLDTVMKAITVVESEESCNTSVVRNENLIESTTENAPTCLETHPTSASSNLLNCNLKMTRCASNIVNDIINDFDEEPETNLIANMNQENCHESTPINENRPVHTNVENLEEKNEIIEKLPCKTKEIVCDSTKEPSTECTQNSEIVKSLLPSGDTIENVKSQEVEDLVTNKAAIGENNKVILNEITKGKKQCVIQLTQIDPSYSPSHSTSDEHVNLEKQNENSCEHLENSENDACSTVQEIDCHHKEQNTVVLEEQDDSNRLNSEEIASCEVNHDEAQSLTEEIVEKNAHVEKAISNDTVQIVDHIENTCEEVSPIISKNLQDYKMTSFPESQSTVCTAETTEEYNKEECEVNVTTEQNLGFAEVHDSHINSSSDKAVNPTDTFQNSCQEHTEISAVADLPGNLESIHNLTKDDVEETGDPLESHNDDDFNTKKQDVSLNTDEVISLEIDHNQTCNFPADSKSDNNVLNRNLVNSELTPTDYVTSNQEISEISIIKQILHDINCPIPEDNCIEQSEIHITANNVDEKLEIPCPHEVLDDFEIVCDLNTQKEEIIIEVSDYADKPHIHSENMFMLATVATEFLKCESDTLEKSHEADVTNFSEHAIDQKEINTTSTRRQQRKQKMPLNEVTRRGRSASGNSLECNEDLIRIGHNYHKITTRRLSFSTVQKVDTKLEETTQKNSNMQQSSFSKRHKNETPVGIHKKFDRKRKQDKDKQDNLENRRITRSISTKSSSPVEPNDFQISHDFQISSSKVLTQAVSYTKPIQELQKINITSEDSNDSEGLLIDEDSANEDLKMNEPFPKIKKQAICKSVDCLHNFNDDTLDDGLTFRYKPKIQNLHNNKPFRTMAERKAYDRIIGLYVSIERLDVNGSIRPVTQVTHARLTRSRSLDVSLLRSFAENKDRNVQLNTKSELDESVTLTKETNIQRGASEIIDDDEIPLSERIRAKPKNNTNPNIKTKSGTRKPVKVHYKKQHISKEKLKSEKNETVLDLSMNHKMQNKNCISSAVVSNNLPSNELNIQREFSEYSNKKYHKLKLRSKSVSSESSNNGDISSSIDKKIRLPLKLLFKGKHEIFGKELINEIIKDVDNSIVNCKQPFELPKEQQIPTPMNKHRSKSDSEMYLHSNTENMLHQNLEASVTNKSDEKITENVKDVLSESEQKFLPKKHQEALQIEDTKIDSSISENNKQLESVDNGFEKSFKMQEEILNKSNKKSYKSRISSSTTEKSNSNVETNIQNELEQSLQKVEEKICTRMLRSRSRSTSISNSDYDIHKDQEIDVSKNSSLRNSNKKSPKHLSTETFIEPIKNLQINFEGESCESFQTLPINKNNKRSSKNNETKLNIAPEKENITTTPIDIFLNQNLETVIESSRTFDNNKTNKKSRSRLKSVILDTSPNVIIENVTKNDGSSNSNKSKNVGAVLSDDMQTKTNLKSHTNLRNRRFKSKKRSIKFKRDVNAKIKESHVELEELKKEISKSDEAGNDNKNALIEVPVCSEVSSLHTTSQDNYIALENVKNKETVTKILDESCNKEDNVPENQCESVVIFLEVDKVDENVGENIQSLGRDPLEITSNSDVNQNSGESIQSSVRDTLEITDNSDVNVTKELSDVPIIELNEAENDISEKCESKLIEKMDEDVSHVEVSDKKGDELTSDQSNNDNMADLKRDSLTTMHMECTIDKQIEYISEKCSKSTNETENVVTSTSDNSFVGEKLEETETGVTKELVHSECFNEKLQNIPTTAVESLLDKQCDNNLQQESQILTVNEETKKLSEEVPMQSELGNVVEGISDGIITKTSELYVERDVKREFEVARKLRTRRSRSISGNVGEYANTTFDDSYFDEKFVKGLQKNVTKELTRTLTDESNKNMSSNIGAESLNKDNIVLQASDSCDIDKDNKKEIVKTIKTPRSRSRSFFIESIYDLKMEHSRITVVDNFDEKFVKDLQKNINKEFSQTLTTNENVNTKAKNEETDNCISEKPESDSEKGIKQEHSCIISIDENLTESCGISVESPDLEIEKATPIDSFCDKSDKDILDDPTEELSQTIETENIEVIPNDNCETEIVKVAIEDDKEKSNVNDSVETIKDLVIIDLPSENSCIDKTLDKDLEECPQIDSSQSLVSDNKGKSENLEIFRTEKELSASNIVDTTETDIEDKEIFCNVESVETNKIQLTKDIFTDEISEPEQEITIVVLDESFCDQKLKENLLKPLQILTDENVSATLVKNNEECDLNTGSHADKKLSVIKKRGKISKNRSKNIFVGKNNDIIIECTTDSFLDGKGLQKNMKEKLSLILTRDNNYTKSESNDIDFISSENRASNKSLLMKNYVKKKRTLGIPKRMKTLSSNLFAGTIVEHNLEPKIENVVDSIVESKVDHKICDKTKTEFVEVSTNIEIDCKNAIDVKEKSELNAEEDTIAEKLQDDKSKNYISLDNVDQKDDKELVQVTKVIDQDEENITKITENCEMKNLIIKDNTKLKSDTENIVKKVPVHSLVMNMREPRLASLKRKNFSEIYDDFDKKFVGDLRKDTKKEIPQVKEIQPENVSSEKSITSLIDSENKNIADDSKNQSLTVDKSEKTVPVNLKIENLKEHIPQESKNVQIDLEKESLNITEVTSQIEIENINTSIENSCNESSIPSAASEVIVDETLNTENLEDVEVTSQVTSSGSELEKNVQQNDQSNDTVAEMIVTEIMKSADTFLEQNSAITNQTNLSPNDIDENNEILQTHCKTATEFFNEQSTIRCTEDPLNIKVQEIVNHAPLQPLEIIDTNENSPAINFQNDADIIIPTTSEDYSLQKIDDNLEENEESEISGNIPQDLTEQLSKGDEQENLIEENVQVEFAQTLKAHQDDENEFKDNVETTILSSFIPNDQENQTVHVNEENNEESSDERENDFCKKSEVVNSLENSSENEPFQTDLDNKIETSLNVEETIVTQTINANNDNILQPEKENVSILTSEKIESKNTLESEIIDKDTNNDELQICSTGKNDRLDETPSCSEIVPIIRTLDKLQEANSTVNVHDSIDNKSTLEISQLEIKNTIVTFSSLSNPELLEINLSSDKDKNLLSSISQFIILKEPNSSIESPTTSQETNISEESKLPLIENINSNMLQNNTIGDAGKSLTAFSESNNILLQQVSYSTTVITSESLKETNLQNTFCAQNNQTLRTNFSNMLKRPYEDENADFIGSNSLHSKTEKMTISSKLEQSESQNEFEESANQNWLLEQEVVNTNKKQKLNVDEDMYQNKSPDSTVSFQSLDYKFQNVLPSASKIVDPVDESLKQHASDGLKLDINSRLLNTFDVLSNTLATSSFQSQYPVDYAIQKCPLDQLQNKVLLQSVKNVDSGENQENRQKIYNDNIMGVHNSEISNDIFHKNKVSQNSCPQSVNSDIAVSARHEVSNPLTEVYQKCVQNNLIRNNEVSSNSLIAENIYKEISNSSSIASSTVSDQKIENENFIVSSTVIGMFSETHTLKSVMDNKFDKLYDDLVVGNQVVIGHENIGDMSEESNCNLSLNISQSPASEVGSSSQDLPGTSSNIPSCTASPNNAELLESNMSRTMSIPVKTRSSNPYESLNFQDILPAKALDMISEIPFDNTNFVSGSSDGVDDMPLAKMGSIPRTYKIEVRCDDNNDHNYHTGDPLVSGRLERNIIPRNFSSGSRFNNDNQPPDFSTVLESLTDDLPEIFNTKQDSEPSHNETTEPNQYFPDFSDFITWSSESKTSNLSELTGTEDKPFSKKLDIKNVPIMESESPTKSWIPFSTNLSSNPKVVVEIMTPSYSILENDLINSFSIPSCKPEQPDMSSSRESDQFVSWQPSKPILSAFKNSFICQKPRVSVKINEELYTRKHNKTFYKPKKEVKITEQEKTIKKEENKQENTNNLSRPSNNLEKMESTNKAMSIDKIKLLNSKYKSGDKTSANVDLNILEITSKIDETSETSSKSLIKETFSTNCKPRAPLSLPQIDSLDNPHPLLKPRPESRTSREGRYNLSKVLEKNSSDRIVTVPHLSKSTINIDNTIKLKSPPHTQEKRNIINVELKHVNSIKEIVIDKSNYKENGINESIKTSKLRSSASPSVSLKDTTQETNSLHIEQKVTDKYKDKNSPRTNFSKPISVSPKNNLRQDDALLKSKPKVMSTPHVTEYSPVHDNLKYTPVKSPRESDSFKLIYNSREQSDHSKARNRNLSEPTYVNHGYLVHNSDKSNKSLLQKSPVVTPYSNDQRSVFYESKQFPEETHENRAVPSIADTVKSRTRTPTNRYSDAQISSFYAAKANAEYQLARVKSVKRLNDVSSSSKSSEDVTNKKRKLDEIDKTFNELKRKGNENPNISIKVLDDNKIKFVYENKESSQRDNKTNSSSGFDKTVDYISPSQRLSGHHNLKERISPQSPTISPKDVTRKYSDSTSKERHSTAPYSKTPPPKDMKSKNCSVLNSKGLKCSSEPSNPNNVKWDECLTNVQAVVREKLADTPNEGDSKDSLPTNHDRDNKDEENPDWIRKIEQSVDKSMFDYDRRVFTQPKKLN